MAKVKFSLTKDPQESSSGNFRIVSVGHLNPAKNPHAVMQAFVHCDVPGASLTFVGAGELLEQLQDEASKLGCADTIRFTGLVPRDEALRYMLQADLFVSASRGEGLPIAVLEAMACECCLVLSDIPPHREVCTGLDFVPFVTGDDVAGMAKAICEIAQATVAKRQAWGRRCREKCEAAFSVKRMLMKYNELFRQLKMTNES